MLLVASETGHVYTFATRKLQPMITSESGKALIQTCLNSPDQDGQPLHINTSPSSLTTTTGDQRMNPSGFEEPELSYNVDDNEEEKMVGSVTLKNLLHRLIKYSQYSVVLHELVFIFRTHQLSPQVELLTILTLLREVLHSLQ